MLQHLVHKLVLGVQELQQLAADSGDGEVAGSTDGLQLHRSLHQTSAPTGVWTRSEGRQRLSIEPSVHRPRDQRHMINHS